jgi:hypothetical protein
MNHVEQSNLAVEPPPFFDPPPVARFPALSFHACGNGVVTGWQGI